MDIAQNNTPLEELKAPGCFAAASVFSTDSEHCKSCVAYSQCGDASIAMLERIRERVNIDDILRKHKAARHNAALRAVEPSTPLAKSHVPVSQPTVPALVKRTVTKVKVEFAISEVDQSIVATIPVKAQAYAIVLLRNNRMQDLRESLPRGVNSLPANAPGFIRLAFDLLIEGGFTYDGYREALMERLKMTKDTATTQISIAICILMKFNFAIQKNGFVSLSPTLFA